MTTIEGYGASLEYDDAQIIIHLNKVSAKVTGTTGLRVPRADIAHIKFRDASMMINGEIRFTVTGDPNSYAMPAADKPVPHNAFLVHFRKKDGAAFRAAFEELAG